MMKKFTITLALALLAQLSVMAQSKADTAQSPRAITWKDIPAWRSFSPNAVMMSPDGKWVAYALTAREGEGELFVKAVKDTAQQQYALGSPNSPAPFFFFGRWQMARLQRGADL
ncbi:hypothetical protein MKQ70_34705 [Chitinophaga sedimenti]|uniref:hypothetical protein n=1 Tax=Chitinophaga sedimenti TaxID=2033606 RepID=UPI002004A8C0|nr:hypothetical protein [Chitinophaga sedimenti]MCK7559816.1 hypothetical protein [Chitinophaga sedimenti]